MCKLIREGKYTPLLAKIETRPKAKKLRKPEEMKRLQASQSGNKGIASGSESEDDEYLHPLLMGAGPTQHKRGREDKSHNASYTKATAREVFADNGVPEHVRYSKIAT